MNTQGATSRLAKVLLAAAVLPWLLVVMATFILALPVPALVLRDHGLVVQPHALASSVLASAGLLLAVVTALLAATILWFHGRSRCVVAALALCMLFVGGSLAFFARVA